MSRRTRLLALALLAAAVPAAAATPQPVQRADAEATRPVPARQPLATTTTVPATTTSTAAPATTVPPATTAATEPPTTAAPATVAARRAPATTAVPVAPQAPEPATSAPTQPPAAPEPATSPTDPPAADPAPTEAPASTGPLCINLRGVPAPAWFPGALAAAGWPEAEHRNACLVFGCESDFNPGAVGPLRTVGLAQIMYTSRPWTRYLADRGATTAADRIALLSDPVTNLSIALQGWTEMGGWTQAQWSCSHARFGA